MMYAGGTEGAAIGIGAVRRHPEVVYLPEGAARQPDS